MSFKLPLRNWAGSLFLEGILGREKQVLPGGVACVGLAGFVGWGFGERGDERQRRPVATSSRVPGPRPGVAGPLPALPGIPGCPCSEGTPGGKRRSQRLHPFIPPSFHPSFSPSLHPSMSPSFHPFNPSILLSPLSPGRGFIASQRQNSSFLLKIKGKKNPQSGLNSQSPSPTLSPRAPRGHSNALPGTQHSQAETISSSLVRNGRVYLSQPLILLTLLLFGP